MSADPTRWDRLQRLFFEIIDLDPPGRRHMLDRLEREGSDLTGELRGLIDAAADPRDRVSEAVSAGAALVASDAAPADPGRPIDQYCDDRRFTLRERLRLFRAICTADPAVEDGTILLDRDGNPERGSTPADVGSCGAVLYTLLTGARSKDEAVAPSKLPWKGRGADRGDWTAYRVARDRRLRPAVLRRKLRGDLDAITMKALSPKPTKRYASVEELSEEIGRHLECRPVLARPQTWVYRAERFFSRWFRSLRPGRR